MSEQPVTISITLQPKLAQHLAPTGAPNFYFEQMDRFEVFEGEDGTPLQSEAFINGTFNFAYGMAEAVLFRAYEQAQGFDAMLLWDMVDQKHVVASTRPWSHGGA